MKEFKGKVAVITGAASGIGRGIAERCAKECMQIVLADIEEKALSQTDREMKASGATVLAVPTDVSKRSDVEALAKKAVDAFGEIHLLCNNAGVGAGGSIWETSLADWEWVLGVNLWGVIHGVRVFVPIMLSQDSECHIVNTASIAGLLPNHPTATYHVTKHAVVALSEHLYQSLAQKGTKVKTSVLCPGFVRTQILTSARNRPSEFQDDSGGKPVNPEDEEARWINLRDQYRVISPAQVADAVFDAIREERFYIFTHPEFNEMVKKRMDDILQGRNPLPIPVSF